jgi:hypothetical protein
MIGHPSTTCFTKLKKKKKEKKRKKKTHDMGYKETCEI